jgi:ATP-dependent helicase IRC3
MGMRLRPYQERALSALRERKVPRGILAMATGTGKGKIAGLIPEAMGADSVLYLAHRDELISQLEGHIRDVHGDGAVSVEQADRRASPFARFVVASVPTIATRNGRRLSDLGRDRFDLVVCDEAHHSMADTYMRTWRHFGIIGEGDERPSSPLVELLGMTATPERGDGIGLCNVYDEILFRYPIREAIRDGYLVPISAFTVKTKVSLDDVRITHGRYVDRDLSRAVAVEERAAAIFDAHQSQCHGMKTLIFCVDIDHAVQMADFFCSRGLDARHIDGQMAMEDRRGAMRWFHRTPGACLTNCMIATEGVDIPSVECVIMARPTKSGVLYAQMLGRGTRLAHGAYDYEESVRMGKDRLVVLDVTDTTRSLGHQALSISDTLGARERIEFDGENVLDEIDKVNTAVRAMEEARANAEQVQTVIQHVNLFADVEPIKGSRFDWVDAGSTIRLGVFGHGNLRIESDEMDRWSCHYWNKETGEESVVGQGPNRDLLVKEAERWITRKYPWHLIKNMSRSAGWKSNPVTEKQLKWFRKFGVEPPCDLTAGRASQILTRLFASKPKTYKRY